MIKLEPNGVPNVKGCYLKDLDGGKWIAEP
jgi:hypothetical protein